MKKFVIFNCKGERMWQWPTFYYADLAQSVCNRQNTIRPGAGFHVVQLEGGVQ